jgi:hypothetical protein
MIAPKIVQTSSIWTGIINFSVQRVSRADTAGAKMEIANAVADITIPVTAINTSSSGMH